jgi:hypothetical protein
VARWNSNPYTNWFRFNFGRNALRFQTLNYLVRVVTFRPVGLSSLDIAHLFHRFPVRAAHAASPVPLAHQRLMRAC